MVSGNGLVQVPSTAALEPDPISLKASPRNSVIGTRVAVAHLSAHPPPPRPEPARPESRCRRTDRNSERDHAGAGRGLEVRNRCAIEMADTRWSESKISLFSTLQESDKVLMQPAYRGLR